jgi:membrane associated rhomboid family serine protease
MNLWRLPGLAWGLVCLALAVPAVALGWAPLNEPAQWPPIWQHLVLRPPAAWQQAPWVFWTTAWLHGSEHHFAFNLIGLALLAAMGWRLRLGAAWAFALFLAWPLTHLALLLDPRLTHYMGASGVLHAGLVLWLVAARQRLGMRVFLVALALVLAKVAWEAAASLGSGPALIRPGADLPVAVWAHVSGVAAGLLLAGIHGAQRHHTI